MPPATPSPPACSHRNSDAGRKAAHLDRQPAPTGEEAPMPDLSRKLRDNLAETLVSAIGLAWTLGFFVAVHEALLKLAY